MKNKKRTMSMLPDYRRRLAQLQSGLRRHGWDALWVSKAANRRYLSGFTGTAGWLAIPATGKPVLITDGRYAQQSRQETQGLSIMISQKDPMVLLARILQAMKAVHLGFEQDDISVASWRRIKQMLPGVKCRNAAGWVETLRVVKDPVEIANIRRALEMSVKAYQRVVPAIKPGKTEAELAAALEKAMLESGSAHQAFPVIMASGPNAALPHASPTDRRLKAGDLLLIDFGCTCQGYHSDLTRTLAVSRATGRQREIYRIVKQAQTSAQKFMRAGDHASAADQEARRIFQHHRLEKHFMHSLGHGLGLEVHESPRVSCLSKDILQAGMVITCEPGLYFSGWGGVRIEDDVAVEPQAGNWLSQSPDELQVVGARR